ncbi:MAG: UDP-N-acetylmuramoyl-L-alanine--D-glutamate ligase [Verrucomicrobiales bacterium]|nr:UDP-N-acetylmuramoyl-L-alanine--D-glutamate ligase [Verrucomicrobiales bacterium]
MKDQGKKIAVLGAGASGIAAARLAMAGGALVCIFDTAPAESFADRHAELRQSGIEMRCGQDALQAPEDLDLIVLSPGIARDTVLVKNFLATGTTMVGEIEFAFQRDQRPVVAITGTNGKTTTTELLTHLLTANGKPAVAAGNYGKPYSEVVLEQGDWEVVVLEVSSFQLEEIDSFHPQVSVWMNFAPDHMDRYHHLEDYRQAKLRIFENQQAEDTAIVKAGEEVGELKARRMDFSAFGEQADFTYDEGKILYHGEPVADFRLSQLHGRHNAENVMAAMAAASVMGVKWESMQQALQDYVPPAHRCEKVGEVDGVSFVNDSKATNLHALESSLRGQEAPVVLIVGGKDKGLDYSEITQAVEKQVKHVFAIGEMGERIVELWSERLPCVKKQSLEQAVMAAFKVAEKGQVVLFSPGTSSFDMFSGYVERGENFRNIINQIITQQGELV